MSRFRLSTANSMMLLAALWTAFVVADPVRFWIDDVFASEPWFSAAIDIDGVDDLGYPRVQYTRQINRTLEGKWSAWVQLPGADGGPPSYVCGDSGGSQYFKFESGRQSYSWKGFIGKVCPVPKQPWELCASWTMQDVNGRIRFFEDVCSPVQPPSK